MTKEYAMEECWRELMVAAQDGDRVAYERLLREVTPFLRVLVSNQTSCEIAAQDVVQVILQTSHRMRHTYDPRRPFKRWLVAIAIRCCIHHQRRSISSVVHAMIETGFYMNPSSLALHGRIKTFFRSLV
jgi:DNA-directed RNA polymerase specialized sigma24 family protein